MIEIRAGILDAMQSLFGASHCRKPKYNKAGKICLLKDNKCLKYYLIITLCLSFQL